MRTIKAEIALLAVVCFLLSATYFAIDPQRRNIKQQLSEVPARVAVDKLDH